MAKTSNYPNITYEMVFNIYSIGQEVKKDRNYIANSPYSDAIKKSLNLIFPQIVVNIEGTSSNNSSKDLTSIDLESEIKSLYWETKKLLSSKELDDKDRASLQKTAANQLEKLLGLMEKSINLNQMKEFESKTLKILKKVLPEQRDEFMRELVESEANEAIGKVEENING